SRRRHTRCYRDWSSDVCSSDLRLRVRCYHTLGDRQQAAAEEQRAAAAQPTALDHFLEAEEYRIRSGSPAEASGDALAWQPSAERSEERRVGKEGGGEWLRRTGE